MAFSIIAISLGAALGALCRWFLGLALNWLYPAIPPGTLAANLVGGYIMGLAVALFARLPDLSANWRLFLITGFLGALTTFSSFTAEIGRLIQQERYLMAFAGCAMHVLGSLGMFFLGLGTFALLKLLPGCK